MAENGTEKKQVVKRPITWAVYKGMGGKFGCFQFSLIYPYTKEGKDEGAVLINAAPTTGKNQYDWEHKLVFALSVNDIGQVLAGVKSGKVELFHDPNAGTEQKNKVAKKFVLQRMEQGNDFFMNLFETMDGNTKKVSVPLQISELCVLVKLLEAAIPIILNWTETRQF